MPTYDEMSQLDSLLTSIGTGASARTATEVPPNELVGSILRSIAEGQVTSSPNPYIEGEGRNARLPIEAKTVPPNAGVGKPVPLYTNVPSVKAKNPDAIFVGNDNAGNPSSNPNNINRISNNLGLTDSKLSLDKMAEMVSQIDKMPSDQRASAVASLEGSIAAEKTRFYNEAVATSEAEFGIPKLMEELKWNEEDDKKYPDWQRFHSDSRETAAIRVRMQSAQAAARADVAEKLKGNATFMAFDSTSTSLINSAKTSIMKGLNREERQVAEAETKMASLSPDNKRALSQIFPDIPTDDSISYMSRVQMIPAKDKQDFNMALMSPEKDVKFLAVAGNAYAMSRAIDMEVKNTGVTEEEARLKVSRVQANLLDISSLQNKFKEMAASGFIHAPEKSEIANKASVYLNPMIKQATPETKAEAKDFQLKLALKYADYQALKETKGNVLSWNSTEKMPLFLEAAKEDPAYNKGVITQDEAIAIANSADTVEGRRANIQELKSYMSGMIANKNKSQFGNLDPRLPDAMATKAALSYLGVAGAGVNYAVEGIASVGNTLGAGMMVAAKAPLEYLSQPIDSMDFGRALGNTIADETKDTSKAGFKTLNKIGQDMATNEPYGIKDIFNWLTSPLAKKESK